MKPALTTSAAVLLLFTTACRAQQPILTFDERVVAPIVIYEAGGEEAQFIFDWPAIEKCAVLPWPKAFLERFGVAACRVALDAHSCPAKITLDIRERGYVFQWDLDGSMFGFSLLLQPVNPKTPSFRWPEPEYPLRFLDTELLIRIAKAARRCEVTS
jgi:hypothetical protein